MKNYIIMSVHNRLKLTKKTIEQTFDFAGAEFVLWVVSDGSTDGTKEYFEALKPWGFCKDIQFKHFDAAKGKAKRLNAFLEKKDYDYCTVIDNDVLLPVDWLEKSIDILDRYKEQVGMCCVNVQGLIDRITVKDVDVPEFLVAAAIGGACTTWGSFVRDNITLFCEEYGRYGHEDAHITQQVRTLNKAVVCLRDFGIHLDDRFEKSKYDSDWDTKYKKMKEDFAVKGRPVLIRNAQNMMKDWENKKT